MSKQQGGDLVDTAPLPMPALGEGEVVTGSWSSEGPQAMTLRGWLHCSHGGECPSCTRCSVCGIYLESGVLNHIAVSHPGLNELRASVCRAFELREGVEGASLRVGPALVAWSVVEPADTLVEVYIEGGASLVGAGLGEVQALERLLASLEGRPVPAIG